MIIDRIIPGRFETLTGSAIIGTEVIRANNVSLHLNQIAEKESWRDEDFPNVVPPFNTTWTEWKYPAWQKFSGEVRRVSLSQIGREIAE